MGSIILCFMMFLSFTVQPIVACLLVLSVYVLVGCWVSCLFGVEGGVVLVLVFVGGTLVVFSYVVGFCFSPVFSGSFHGGFNKFCFFFFIFFGLCTSSFVFASQVSVFLDGWWNWLEGVEISGGFSTVLPGLSVLLFLNVVGGIFLCLKPSGCFRL